jgi:hypothetical protein
MKVPADFVRHGCLIVDLKNIFKIEIPGVFTDHEPFNGVVLALTDVKD